MIYKIFTLIFALTLSFTNFSYADDLPEYAPRTQEAKVLEIVSEDHDKDLEDVFQTDQIIQTIKIKILNGNLKNQNVIIKNFLTNNPAFDISLKKGDKILIDVDEMTNDINISAKDNSAILFGLLAILSALALIFYGKMGAKILASLTIAILTIFAVLIPMIFRGISPVIATFLVSTFIILESMLIIHGIRPKSICALIGSIFTLFFVTVFYMAITILSSLNGVDSQEGIILFGNYPKMDFLGILISSTIIASIGVIISVCVSIANYIFVYANDSMGFLKIFKSTMNFYRGTIANMTFTLVFLYFGLMFSFFMLSYNTYFIKFINFNKIFFDITSLLTIISAVLFCAPITATICTIWIKRDILLKKFKRR